MGVIQAFAGAVGGTLADQWRDVITAGRFGERTVVAPGVTQSSNSGRGTNHSGSVGVITNGSKIFVPENTAAVVFSQAGIEDIIVQAGGYEYRKGQPSILNGDGFTASVVHEAVDRFKFGGQTSDQRLISFINLRELRGIKFGTRGPMSYHDRFYDTDLEVTAFGTFSLRVCDVVAFVKNFLPPNSRTYAFDSPSSTGQLISEFLQALMASVNVLSASCRVSQLPGRAEEISAAMAGPESSLGSWRARFGLSLERVGLESIEFSAESRELVRQFSANRMSVAAYEGITQRAADIAAQQRIAQGVQEHGLGDGAGMMFGVGLAQNLSPQNASHVRGTDGASVGEQIETVKKLKELLDAGILTQEEFDAKKHQVMGL